MIGLLSVIETCHRKFVCRQTSAQKLYLLLGLGYQWVLWILATEKPKRLQRFLGVLLGPIEGLYCLQAAHAQLKLRPAREGVQRIEFKKLLIFKTRFEIVALAIQCFGNLKLRLRFQVAVGILFEELLIVFARLRLVLTAEFLLTQAEVVFRGLGFFLLPSTTTAEQSTGDE